MKKSLHAFVGLGVALLIVGPITGLKIFQIGHLIAYAQEMGAGGPPPTKVASAIAENQSWENALRATGSLDPVQGVILAAELGGKVVEIAVESGATVKAGDLLVRLDSSSETARLAAAQATLRLAQVNLDRASGLLAQTTISQSEFDSADATQKQALAELATIQATLDKKSILAPFAGRVGIRLVNLGQTLREGEAIIPLQTLDPIFVNFAIPQQHIGSLTVGQKLRVEIDGVAAAIEGELTAINPQVDAATRNVRVQGTLANPTETLRPGMFAQVSLVLPTAAAVLAVPATAVVRAPFGDSVFIVEEKDGKQIAKQQFVKVGRSRGDFIAIVEGLKTGDRIVTAGAHKLLNGAPLLLDDSMQPPTSLTPTPKNS